MKITIISSRAFTIPAKEGGLVSGTMYAGFILDPLSQKVLAIEFSSKNSNHKVYMDAFTFDPNRCEDIDLQTTIFDGKVKRREVAKPNLDPPPIP